MLENNLSIEMGSIKKSDQINEIAEAMAKVQGGLRALSKNSKGHNFQYADLFEVTENIREVAPQNGIAYIQFPSAKDGMVGVTTLITHTSGQYLESTVITNISKLPGGSEIQGFGSTLTYLRRYALVSVFGMAQADDAAIETRKYAAEVEKEISEVSDYINTLESAKDYAALKDAFGDMWRKIKSPEVKLQIKSTYEDRKAFFLGGESDEAK